MYRRECNGYREYCAWFRFCRPDGDVYPYGSDTPDDVLPYDDHDEAEKIYEKKDSESGPLMICILIWFAWFPGITEFNANEEVHVRF